MEGKEKEDEWANIFITVNHSASTREVHTTRKQQQQSGTEKGRIAGIRTEKEMHQELCCIVQLSARPRYIAYTSRVHTHTNTYSHKRQTRRHTLGMCRVLFLFFFSLFPNGRFPGTGTCRHVRPPTEHTHKPPNTGAVVLFILFLYSKMCWSATAILFGCVSYLLGTRSFFPREGSDGRGPV